MPPTPLTPRVPQVMTPPQDSPGVSSSVLRDPWDWTVDEVVATLCGRSHALLASVDPRSLPEPVHLEKALRENGVSGPTLLLELDHASLRDDLGIRTLGPRGTIMQMIKRLRRQSQKYLDHVHEEAVYTPLPEYGRISNVGQTSWPGSSYHGSPPQYAPRAASSTTSGFLQSPTALGGRLHNSLQLHSVAGGGSTPSTQRFIEQPQNSLREVPDLSQSNRQNPEHPGTVGEFHLPGNALIGADLPEPFRAGGDLEAIGFNAKEETILEDSNFFNYPAHNPEPSRRQGETFVIDGSGRKRRKLMPEPAQSAEPAEPTEPAETVDDHRQATSRTAERITAFSVGETFKNSGTGNTSNASIDVEVPVEQSPNECHIENVQDADKTKNTEEPHTSLQVDGISSIISEAMHEPGVLAIDSQGRKRMRPILISQIEPSPELDTEPLDQRTHDVSDTAIVCIPLSSDKFSGKSSNQDRKPGSRKPTDVYLGLEHFPVDRIFYGNTAFGRELENDSSDSESLRQDAKDGSDLFTFYTSNRKSVGQRHYVSGRIKHFLLSGQTEMLGRNGKGMVGVVPYPSRIAKLHQPLSMTLFSRLQGNIAASRVNRLKWIEDDVSYSIKQRHLDADPMKNAFAAPDSPFTHNLESNKDWDYLEKWKYANGDEVLPAYGESGSDGEYDMDTWLEIEKDYGKVERPLGRRRRKRLSDQVVKETIDDALNQIVRDWHSKEEGKLKPRAWRLWNKSRRDRNKHEQMKRSADSIEKLENRLVKLREEIAKEEWSVIQELIKQCKIMQPSVFDHELCKWKLSVLRLKSAPEKPRQPVKKPKSDKIQSARTALGKDKEDGASNVNNTESSEGDLDDFAVDDDADERSVLDEGNMSEVGDEEASVTLLADDENNLEPSVSPKAKIVLNPQIAEPVDQEPLVAPPPKVSPRQFSDIIDLTQQSDTDEEEISLPKREPYIGIRTPPLYSSDDDPFTRNRKRKPEFKLPPVADSIVALDSDPVYFTAGENGPEEKLPGLQDVDSIKKLDPRILVERGDRKRLLLYHISKTPPLERDLAFIHLQEVCQTELETAVRAGLRAMKSHSLRIRGVDKEDSEVIMRIAVWWVCWTVPLIVEPKSGLRVLDIDTVLSDKEGFHQFHQFLITCPKLYEKESIPEVISLESDSVTPVKKKRQKLLLEGSDEDLRHTPNKKRKFALPESQATLSLRASAQQRVQDRDKRQKELKRRFDNMGANDDPSKVVVNVGKFDHQHFIYLNPLISDRIQPHQIEGVQFMWREITTDPDNLQGCLLAQTMGLGKTMQVITLLVTIAEAARSSNENIRHQIPLKLRESKTLILCPPALIENWWEEFLMWTPMPTSNNIGEIRKITTTLKPNERLWEIQAWTSGGGVLLMGFNVFRAYIDNRARKAHGDSMLEEDQHTMVKEALLKRPIIVVADEAHALKNASTGINAAMSRIETKSRIALTGSPLMNNLGEYYSLIEWIAPNFLGTRPEFRANFEEPIQEGFYQDSTYGQYRYSMKKLAALKTDLEPKTHRADISVLKGRLKEKQEFVIRVPLTKLQEQIYRIYVDCMLHASKDNEPTVATLWAWLATLRLLCNHPKCFRDRLLAKEEEGKKAIDSARKKEEGTRPSLSKEELNPLDEDTALLDEPVSAIGITKTMVEKQLSPFNTLTEPLDSVTLAYKMQILTDILDLSKQAQDKVLVFSHSIPTLDFVQNFLEKSGRTFSRIDGKIKPSSRQQLTKAFNTGMVEVFLISTKSGGQGLNMFGANRVVILDDNFNPMYEEQAVGRAYRLGQLKPVFVYYLTVAGTFEEAIQNQSLFKQQLAKRVVDSKNPIRRATKGIGQYLFPPRAVAQQNLGEFLGNDPLVLDRIVAKYGKTPIIRSMDLTETFHQEDDMKLTEEEKKEAEQMQKDEQLRRRNPGAYSAMLIARREEDSRTLRLSTAQVAPWTASPAGRPLSTQGPLLNSDFGVNGYALLHGAPVNTFAAMKGPLPQTAGMSAPNRSLHLAPEGHAPGPLPITRTRSSASLPPEPQSVGEKPFRGASEPSDNRLDIPNYDLTSSLGLSSKSKPSLNSKLDPMASPSLTSKPVSILDATLERAQTKNVPEMKVFTTRRVSVIHTPAHPADTKSKYNDGETDGKAQDCMPTSSGIETNKEQPGADEQKLVDTTSSLKRKREVDTMSSKASAEPVTSMFSRLLRREANRTSNATLDGSHARP